MSRSLCWLVSIYLVGEKVGWWTWAQIIISNNSDNMSPVKPNQTIRKERKNSWTRVVHREDELVTWHNRRETNIFFIYIDVDTTHNDTKNIISYND